MSDRVTDDPELKDHAGRTILYRPIIIVEATEDNKQIYRLHLTELDPLGTQPTLYGILLSDLLDHIAHAYWQSTGRDPRDLREEIAKVMRDEDRFKDKDPRRGQLRGAVSKPPAQ